MSSLYISYSLFSFFSVCQSYPSMDRVHPVSDDLPETYKPPMNRKGTYVIKIPKDQVYRVPPLENAKLYESYRRKSTRSRHSCCCMYVLLILLALTLAAAILYLVFQPKFPTYSVTRISIKASNVTDTEFGVTILANNPNKKIGIYYRGDGSDVIVAYPNVLLGRGVWPTFYHETRNVTEFRTVLKGSGKELSERQAGEEVPLEIDAKVPIRVRVGSITSWTITARVACSLLVDKLTEDATIVSENCNAGSSFW